GDRASGHCASAISEHSWLVEESQLPTGERLPFIYYDWMSRDFFHYLKNQNPDQRYWLAPGSNQYVYRKGSFEYKALRCYNIAREAIDYESRGMPYTANKKWREIYGTKFPN
ncbi:hypothetical protein ACXHQ6_17645, partial [Vibrio brasiliensis]